VLLIFGAPSQLLVLEGLEHGRTIPLADIASLFFRRCEASKIGAGGAGLAVRLNLGNQ